jgi:homoserine kinase type II
MAQDYALGALVSAEGIAEGVSNTNYRLAVRGAAGDKTSYILTLFEKPGDAESLPFYLQFMAHVAGRGVACPNPLPGRDGSVISSLAGKPAVIISFLEGASRKQFSDAHIASMGQTVARLHVAAADFAPRRANTLSLSGWQMLHDILRGKLDGIQPGLEDVVAAEMGYLAKHWGRVAALPRGVIHADLFPDNVFYSGDAVSGIIDFYFACEDALAYDVAIVLNAWCFDAAHRFDAARAKTLLDAYQMLRPFTAAETAAFPLLLRGAAMRFLLTRARDWIHRSEGALVTPKDPLEYALKLKHFQAGNV